MPQMMLISVVLPAPFGPEQREYLAAADLQVDAFQGLEPGGIGLHQPADIDNWRFGSGHTRSDFSATRSL